jgi:hypothetical protein
MELFAVGKVAVPTSAGTEGLAVEGRDFLILDSPSSIGEAVPELLKNLSAQELLA